MTALKLIHVKEPLLEFRFGQKLVYPRDGLFLYGPIDGGRPEINYFANVSNYLFARRGRPRPRMNHG
jgi:hypothetical protein